MGHPVVQVACGVVAFVALCYNCIMLNLSVEQLHANDFGKFYYATQAWWTGGSLYAPNLATHMEVELRSGRWTTTHPGAWDRTVAYLEALEAGGRYPHVVWPEHCLIGTEGHAVHPKLMEALREWEERFALVDFVTKGSNPWTEHFSAVQAEVPDPEDPGTQVNTALVRTLEDADVVLLAGEASSHCLANTVRDIAAHFADPRWVKKLVLLEDATSPVPGFESYATDFVRDMTALGMSIDTTARFAA